MIYQDSINFPDEDVVRLYEFGSVDDLMALESMSAHGKKPQFEFFGINSNSNSDLHYFPQYDSPLANQNDLAALPISFGDGFDNSSIYSQSQPYEYTEGQITPVSTTAYSTVPAAALVQSSHLSKVSTQYAASQRSPKRKASVNEAISSYSDFPRKRKASVESFDSEVPTSKRVAVAVQDPQGDYYDLKSEPSPYSSFVPTPTTIPSYHTLQQPAVSPRVYGHQHTASNVSQISMPAPYTPIVSPAFTTAHTEHSPHPPATPALQPSSPAFNPRLVRTSTIPNHSPQASCSGVPLVGHTQNFNPYTLYSPDSKARLHLDGNLDDVAKDWTDEEIEARRKIIIFNRDQKGNDIYADFKVVSQNEWKNHPRSVSCIWWAEKKEAYVTSVDTILLLEALVAARFTVEEKNRIRRNLEGFKPDTVSKAKPDTEEFFKVIMGFPNPKPRNIEKDVKVFPWKVLQVALQKIISKYSASYASTAASISGVQAKMYRGVEQAEYSYSMSPGPEYAPSVPQLANFPTYEQHGRNSAPVTPMPNMHHMPPSLPATHDVHATYNYPQVHIPPQHHVQYQPAPMTAPITATPYWQYPAYSTDGGIPMGPVSAPPTAYPREMMEAANYRPVPLNVHPVHR